MNKTIYTVSGGCVLCGTCQSVCPADAVELGTDGARIAPARCIGCGKCMDNCPVEVIEPELQSPNEPSHDG